MKNKKWCSCDYYNVLFIITHKRKQLKCPQTGEWTKKLIYPNNRILFGNKGIFIDTQWYGWISNASVKKARLKEYLLSNSTHMTLQKRQSWREREIRSVFTSDFEWGKSWLLKRQMREYLGVIGLFYILVVVVVTQLYTFVIIYRTVYNKG